MVKSPVKKNQCKQVLVYIEQRRMKLEARSLELKLELANLNGYVEGLEVALKLASQEECKN